MDSDGEPMEEPPADYYQTRRRSNTLPTEILRHLRDKHSKKKDGSCDVDSDDEPDGEGRRNHHGKLTDKLKRVTINEHGSNESLKGCKKNTTKGIPKSCLSHRHQVTSYDDDPLSRKLNPNHISNNRLDGLRTNLVRTTSDDTLMIKSRRKPLPRGSNVYEKALEDFGHNEEDRDSVSPLPSPQIIRRGRHSAKHGLDDVTCGVTSSSPPRHVHWGQDARTGKPKR